MTTVKVGDETTIHTFQVVEDLGTDIIVGNDLMKKIGFTINFNREVIQMRMR